jgi:hypothetical protein
VRLSDGSVRNAYTIRVVNKRPQARQFSLGVSGLPAVTVDFMPPHSDGSHLIDVGPDQTREVRLLVTNHGPLPQGEHAESERIVFHLTDVATGDQVETLDHFFGPED